MLALPQVVDELEHHRMQRLFSLALIWVVLSVGLTGAARAQDGFVEGQHYVRLATAAPGDSANTSGTIEVVEFFWYGSPASRAAQPTLDAWTRTLPSDVSFRRVPVGFALPHQLHQRLFHALESLGRLESLHERVFAAMHVQGQRMLTERDVQAWVANQGIDAQQFGELMRSQAVEGAARQPRQVVERYRVDGVPSLGVNGRYFTSATLAGDFSRALAVANFLIERERARQTNSNAATAPAAPAAPPPAPDARPSTQPVAAGDDSAAPGASEEEEESMADDGAPGTENTPVQDEDAPTGQGDTSDGDLRGEAEQAAIPDDDAAFADEYAAPEDDETLDANAARDDASSEESDFEYVEEDIESEQPFDDEAEASDDATDPEDAREDRDPEDHE
jgi:thiol:disulfide interchange protein DsbA